MGERKGQLLVGVAAGIVLAAFLFLVWRNWNQVPDADHREPTPAPTRTAQVPALATEALEGSQAEARRRMVEYQIRARGVGDAHVLEAMETVPRHEFVPEEYLQSAYGDGPLPIGYGQTISQPYIVALMTELLELDPGDKVLEIGTGSGYQAAILAQLTDQVYTMEIIPELAGSARELLEGLGYDNINFSNADGYFGWEDYAPFDAIIVTAAPDHVPQPLVQQLKEGGRMVIPVGPVGWYQTLWLISMEDGEAQYHNKGGVQFVPFTGEH